MYMELEAKITRVSLLWVKNKDSNQVFTLSYLWFISLSHNYWFISSGHHLGQHSV